MINPFCRALLLLLFFLVWVPVARSQQHQAVHTAQPATGLTPACGTDQLLQQMRTSAGFRQQEELFNQRILSASAKLDTTILEIPVVFHIINTNPSAVSDAAILSALQNLNDAFGKTGPYAASLGADTRIRFCLARTDPDGGRTTGITRTTSFFANSVNTTIEDRKLKNLIQWDPRHYVNIWYVSSLETEIFARFGCGNWSRMRMGGYATLPPGGGPLDGIVVTTFGPMLAHEMGHYLGLYHTFEGLNCLNLDCTTNGDRVCDTPPDATMTGGCSGPQNSCGTDTLSGFTTDQNDRAANFMDYGNGSCQNEFTQGQADRMRAVIATARAGLLVSQCNPPCAGNATAYFLRSQPYANAGEQVQFTNASTGASSYEWLLDGAVVATTPNYTHTFSTPGRFKITLKAYSSATCFAAYTTYVIVGCGVTARFYTDKQTLASKAPIYLDSIRFTNTSENAASYQWLLAAGAGTETVVGTATQLRYVFGQPGNYSMRLVATAGGCSDTTDAFPITVTDPTADGALFINRVECFQQNKVRVSLTVCNNGYEPLPAGTPVSFYDSDPSRPGAQKLGATWYLPTAVQGLCCSPAFTTVVDAQRIGLNQLFAVFNDSGSAVPVQLPGTALAERFYGNNIASATGFRYQVSVSPALLVMEPKDTAQLRVTVRPTPGGSLQWLPVGGLSCTNCATPRYIADTIGVQHRVVGTSSGSCTDTAYVMVQIPPYNNYSVGIDSVRCLPNDSIRVHFTLRNAFRHGNIPAGLPVAFFNGATTAGAAPVQPLFVVPQTVAGTSASYSWNVGAAQLGTLVAVVNSLTGMVPWTPGADTAFKEKDYSNNSGALTYTTGTLLTAPADTLVLRRTAVPVQVLAGAADPAAIRWQAGSSQAISCTACPGVIVTPFASDTLRLQATNRYGCNISGQVPIRVLAPDYTVQIAETACFTNTTTQVRFRVCVANNYDTLPAGLAVTFYDGNPANRKPLGAAFRLAKPNAGACAEWTYRVATPASGLLTAVVNDEGNGVAGLPEAVLSNNSSSDSIAPFRVTILPSDTSVLRQSVLQLSAVASGGTLTAYNWTPVRLLSCGGCAAPTIQVAYSTPVMLVARNQYQCTDTAYAQVNMFTAGLLPLPNAFTPDGDGRNDRFYVLAGAGVAQVQSFRIFNRWGMQVFGVQGVPPNDPAYGWDGAVNGQPAASGTFVYTLQVLLTDGSTRQVKGTVVVVR